MRKYCLDTNVYIEAWSKYYSMDLCPEYWDILDQLASQKIIFSPLEVKKEIEKTEDGLSNWIKDRNFLFRDINITIQENLRIIMDKHGRLVDSNKQRSVADPWVIAYAMAEDAVVVTKETPTLSQRRIKIPDVCEALGVSWIDDFEFARQIGIKFTATISA